jgi:hypothetical protein
MANERQIAANRDNARKSTGPKTIEGKLSSRGNALRHGLTGESVISCLEDRNEYMAFEAEIVADYAPSSTIEQIMVARLASILWRLRRATAIEAGLLQIQSNIVRKRRIEKDRPGSGMSRLHQLLQEADEPAGCPPWQAFGATSSGSVDLALSFLRLSNYDNGAFERLLRYETSLTRHLTRTVETLDVIMRKRLRRRALFKA